MDTPRDFATARSELKRMIVGWAGPVRAMLGALRRRLDVRRDLRPALGFIIALGLAGVAWLFIIVLVLMF